MFEPSHDVQRQLGVIQEQEESRVNDELQALRRISGKLPPPPEQKHPYYDSEQFRRDEKYLLDPHPSESFTLKDFWFWFSHAYHDPALPPPTFGRLVGAFGWVVIFVWGIHRLCS